MGSRHLILQILLVATVSAGVASAGSPARTPALEWQPRSDWHSVREFGASGDGVTDDTTAIQKAFDRLSDRKEINGALQIHVVHFPAGRYRITRTLNITHTTGALVVGHGRDTVLTWDGADDGVMYLSNGAHYTRYEGITWDGRAKAAVGVEHSSQSYYETSIRYEHCAFLACKEHGFLNGRGKEKNAAAEIWFRNCLFSWCGNGASFLNFNDYDNTFDACEFDDCGIGINSHNGNFYARACHFERSRRVDVYQRSPSHASSVRLSTSQGSRRFFETGVGMHYSMKLQDCHVDAWTAPDGAILLGHRGPTTIIDCSFSGPPTAAPPIRLANPKGIEQLLILSGCTSPATTALVDEGPCSRVTVVPAGKLRGCLTGASRRFLRDTVATAGRVLDVVRDFGAKANGSSDDTESLQHGIDMVRRHGQRATLYLPAGTYRLTRTLNVTGNDYTIQGAGFLTVLQWAGPKDGEMIRVHNPRGIAIEHLSLAGSNDVPRIHQTAGGASPSSIDYDEIYTNGCDMASTRCVGLWCDHLPASATVRMGHVIGNLRLSDSGPATILCAVHFYSLKLEGATQPKTGIAGFMFHNDACHRYALDVLDNQDVLVADFYSESNRRYLLCQGTEGQGSGRVTIGASKLCTLDDECITIHNYQGRIFLGGGDGYNQANMNRSLSIVHEGTRPVDFLVAGMGWWEFEPRMTFGPGMRYASLENLIIGNRYPALAKKSLPNLETPTSALSLVAAFDDFRELAHAYLREFYPAEK